MNTERKDPKDYYKQELSLQDLVPGDILTFEGEESDDISSLIMLLTNSMVTHGALYFQNSPVENATLHVPASAVEAYKAAEPWNGFKDIVPLEGESIETTYYTSSTGHIDIYSIDGKLIGSAADQNEAACIVNHLPSGTTAIVRMGGKSVKVVVR